MFASSGAVVRKMLFFWVDWLRVFTRKSKSVFHSILNSILLIEKDNRHKSRHSQYHVASQKNPVKFLEQIQVFETQYMLLNNKDSEEQLALVIKLKSVPNIQSLALVVETYLTPVERIWNKYGSVIFFCGSVIFSSLITMYSAIVLGYFLYKLNKHLSKDDVPKAETGQDTTKDQTDFEGNQDLETSENLRNLLRFENEI